MDILIITETLKEQNKLFEVLLNRPKDAAPLNNHYRVMSCEGAGKLNAAMKVQGFLERNRTRPVDMIAVVGGAVGGSGFRVGEMVLPNSCSEWDVQNADDAPHYELAGADRAILLTGDATITSAIARQLERQYREEYGGRILFDDKTAAIVAAGGKKRLSTIALKVIVRVAWRPIWARLRQGRSVPKDGLDVADYVRFIDVLEEWDCHGI